MPRFALRRGAVGFGIGAVFALPALTWCAIAQAQAPLAASTRVTEITEIVLQRNCFGCASGGVLTLRRDGQATFTTTGNARMGSVDRTVAATVPRADFARLAALVVGQGYFSMADRYEDADLRDGAWTQLGVVRDGARKEVFRREDAGPEALKTIEAEVDALAARNGLVPMRR